MTSISCVMNVGFVRHRCSSGSSRDVLDDARFREQMVSQRFRASGVMVHMHDGFLHKCACDSASIMLLCPSPCVCGTTWRAGFVRKLNIVFFD